ncbi:MAG TPA: hypothetical protein VM146_00905 [Steroidobacteraceae bacterium]|nr:hypothetical protein [Steroidobacteraceae bacterium]
MFAFDRSALAVLAPLALLVGVVLWSHFADAPAAAQQARHDDPGLQTDDGQRLNDGQSAAEPTHQTVAANLPSR